VALSRITRLSVIHFGFDRGRLGRVLISSLILLVGAVVGAQAAQNVRAGRKLAIEACSACHQVTPDQKPRMAVFNPDEYANVVAPPFRKIAAKYAHRPLALRNFILNPTHPMPEQNWDPADLTMVVAFIQSLVRAVPVSR
jgi:cytochrome c551/c552